MTRTATLTLDFTSYWLAGTGAKGGRAFDDVTHRDRWGCPAMPMSQVKGVLRESASDLADLKAAGWSNDLRNQLFGTAQQTGLLAFIGEARLPTDALAWFAAKKPENLMARAQLFRRVPATRIGETGTALDKTLRAVEVAVPLKLTGTIEGPEDGKWIPLIDAACAATLSMGKLRNDGFGRVSASIS